jgi:hypothetical protein
MKTDAERCAEICASVPGYSDGKHYSFFRQVLSGNAVSLLMLGVYFGRDLAFCCDIARDYPERRFLFSGVDKFTDTPCRDWPGDKVSLSWEQAGYGPAPSRFRAEENILRHKPENVTLALTSSDDCAFLESTTQSFDVVYLDTSHDYQTVKRQLSLISNVCHPRTLICGDDYSDVGTWGVKRAVTEAFSSHSVFEEWIWYANFSLLKT